MRELGVRAGKQSLSGILRAVGSGEHVRVTLRGRPIADIVPAREADAWDRRAHPAAEDEWLEPTPHELS